MSKDSEVELKFDDIYWKIVPILKQSADGPLVELQWGWTAGMSEKDLENIADDAPTGYDSVTTTLEMAIKLRNQLNQIIEKCNEDTIDRIDRFFSPELRSEKLDKLA